MNWLTYDKLDSFEKGVADHLKTGLGYSPENALTLTNEYITVLRAISRHYNCEDYAEKIHEAKQNGLSAADWMARIRNLRRETVKDKIEDRFLDRKPKLTKPFVQ